MLFFFYRSSSTINYRLWYTLMARLREAISFIIAPSSIFCIKFVEHYIASILLYAFIFLVIWELLLLLLFFFIYNAHLKLRIFLFAVNFFSSLILLGRLFNSKFVSFSRVKFYAEEYLAAELKKFTIYSRAANNIYPDYIPFFITSSN